jgi:hypothetical protein
VRCGLEGVGGAHHFPHKSQKPVLCTRPFAPVAQLDRASDYESEGRRFESSRVRDEKTQCSLGFCDGEWITGLRARVGRGALGARISRGATELRGLVEANPTLVDRASKVDRGGMQQSGVSCAWHWHGQPAVVAWQKVELADLTAVTARDAQTHSTRRVRSDCLELRD